MNLNSLLSQSLLFNLHRDRVRDSCCCSFRPRRLCTNHQSTTVRLIARSSTAVPLSIRACRQHLGCFSVFQCQQVMCGETARERRLNFRHRMTAVKNCWLITLSRNGQRLSLNERETRPETIKLWAPNYDNVVGLAVFLWSPLPRERVNGVLFSSE